MALTLPLPPVPSLPAAFNGVRPFLRGGLPQPGNAIRPFTRPPVGPAGGGGVPLLRLGPKGAALGLAFAGGYAIGTWIWEQLNRKQQRSPVPSGPGTTWQGRATGTLRTDGSNAWTVGPGTVEVLREGPPGTWTWQNQAIFQRSFQHPYSQVQDLFASFENWSTGPNNQQGYQMRGVRTVPGSWATFFTEANGLTRNPNVPVTVQPVGTSANVIPAPNPGPPVGSLDPFYQPNPVPTPAPLPGLAPAPAPARQPATSPADVPQADPVSPGETDPRRRIAPPVAPERPRPRPLLPPPLDPDTTTPTGPDGEPREREGPGPQTRDPRVISIPGGEVGQPGAQPRPDLQGIAAELGKLEQKLELSLSLQLEGAGGGEPDPLVQEIADLLRAPFPAGSFQLFPACDRDAQGEPLPPAVAPWGAGTGPLELLSRKLDAIQDLIQAHKDFRQPVCRSKPIGEEVTVTFEEVP